MVLFFVALAINILNRALGYALAAYLGFGPPTLADAWRVLFSASPTGMTGDATPGPSQTPQQEPQTACPAVTPLPAASEEASGPALQPEASDLDAFRQFVAMSTSNLSDFDTRLKKSAREHHATPGWTFVAELQEICQACLETLGPPMQQLSEQLGDEIQEVVLKPIAQLETTLSNLHYMDFDSGAAAAIGRLSQETANTLSMAHRLQQAFEAPSGVTGQNASEESPRSLHVEPADHVHEYMVPDMVPALPFQAAATPLAT